MLSISIVSRAPIVVRTAGENENLRHWTALERELAAEDLLICDGDHPVALAGVMGGIDSEVSESTQSILLESANFDATAIRRTAKRLGLHSEASHRFERGVDPDGTLRALDRAAAIWPRWPGQRLGRRRRLLSWTVKTCRHRSARRTHREASGRRHRRQAAEKLLRSLGRQNRPPGGQNHQMSHHQAAPISPVRST